MVRRELCGPALRYLLRFGCVTGGPVFGHPWSAAYSINWFSFQVQQVMQFSTQHGPARPSGTTSATRSEAFCSAEQGFWGGCRGVSRTGPQPSAVAAWPTARLEAGGRPKGLWRAPDRRGWRTDRQRYTLKIRRQRHERSARERESHLKPCKSSRSWTVCHRGRVT